MAFSLTAGPRTTYDAVAAEVAATRVTSLGRDATTPGDDGDRSETDSDDTAAGSRSQTDGAEIWAAIRAVSDFWTTLSPLEPGGIDRLQATATTSLGTVLLDPAARDQGGPQEAAAGDPALAKARRPGILAELELLEATDEACEFARSLSERGTDSLPGRGGRIAHRNRGGERRRLRARVELQAHRERRDAECDRG